MKFKNNTTGGKIYYGIHFYPGLAQYQDEGSDDPYRVYLNEDTLRKMDPTFAGKPVFVQHVDEVDPVLDNLRGEADGWVVESFFNESDGKHWVKFIVVSDEGERAIRRGMRLSNAYIPKAFKEGGGLWNGIPYEKEITDGEYEHLAIVDDPRYEESVIKTPEEFKQYNLEQKEELKKLSNSKKGAKMNFNLFKPKLRLDEKILMPSGRVISLQKLINEAYEKEQDPAMGQYPKVDKGEVVGKKASSKKNISASSDDDHSGESAKHHVMADMNHMVKMHDGSMKSVKDMMHEHKQMKDSMKKKHSMHDSEEEELDLEVKPKGVDAEGDLHNDEVHERPRDDDEWGYDEHEEKVHEIEHEEELKDSQSVRLKKHDDLLDHPEEAAHDSEDEEVSHKEHEEDMMHDAEDPEKDMEAKKKALELAEHEDEELEEAKKKKNLKKKNDLAKAERLKKAHLRVYKNEEAPVLELSYDKVMRGKARYGA